MKKELQQVTRSERIAGLKTHIAITIDDINAAMNIDHIDMVQYYASIIVKLADEVMQLEELDF